MLKMSTLFLRTLRDDPADAEVASHKLLVRAGYVRRIAAGIYSWLPLGVITLRNVERVIREEMDKAGFQEVNFPALLPREAYETTNRWEEYGPSLFRLQDRKGGDYLLGPTHEEMFTLMVKGEYSSYKDLPLSIYQIQTKFRDEARPRSGIIRGREFVCSGLYDQMERHRLGHSSGKKKVLVSTPLKYSGSAWPRIKANASGNFRPRASRPRRSSSRR